MATLKTVTGKVTGPDGSPVPRAVITVTNSQPTTIPGSQEIAQPTTPVTAGPDGSFSLSLYSNNDLTPNGTAYTVQAVGSIGQMPVTMTWTIQVPQTAGPFEISNITTTTPTASPTPTHVSTLTVDGQATFTAGPVILGTDPGGTQILRVGGTGHFSAGVIIDGGILYLNAAANQYLYYTGTQFQFTNTVQSLGGYLLSAGQSIDTATAGALNIGSTTATSIVIGKAGVPATFPGGVTVSAGGITVSAGGLTVSAGGASIVSTSGVSAISVANSANTGQASVILATGIQSTLDYGGVGNLRLIQTGIGYGSPTQQLLIQQVASQTSDFFRFLDSSSNIKARIDSTGAATIANGITVSAGGITVSAGGLTVSASGVKSVVGVRASTSPALTLTDSLLGGGDSTFYFSVPIGSGPDLNINAGRVLFQGYSIQANRIEALGTANTMILFSGGDVLAGQNGGYKFQVGMLDFNPATTKSKFGTSSAGAETAYTVAAFIGATGQTGDLSRWYNAAGTVLASVSSAGLFTLSNGLTVSAGPVIIGTDPGGTQILRVGGNAALVSTSTTGPHLLIQGPTVVAGAINLRLIRPDTGDGIDFSASNAGGQTSIMSKSTATFLIDTGVAATLQIGPNNATALQLGRAAGSIGFYGNAGVAKGTVTGSRGGNAALASLLTALAATGLLTDSSTV